LLAVQGSVILPRHTPLRSSSTYRIPIAMSAPARALQISVPFAHASFIGQRSGRVTLLANLKGGVGKTTTAINLAGLLARGVTDPKSGSRVLPPQRVLVIDFERLRTASEWLGVRADGPLDSCAALFEPLTGDLESGPTAEDRDRILGLCRPAVREPVDVIPSDPRGVTFTDEARGESEYTFADSLRVLRQAYDHILVDLPGQATSRMFRSAFNAADGVLMPVVPDSGTITSMSPVSVAIEDAKRGANRRLQVDGYLLCRAGSKGDVDARLIQEELRAASRYYVFAASIRTLKSIQRAAFFQSSVFGMDASADRGRDDFRGFALEWIGRIGGGVA
jgi:chromosome partitioning protein